MNIDNKISVNTPDALACSISADSHGLSVAHTSAQGSHPCTNVPQTSNPGTGVIQSQNRKTLELCLAAVQRYWWALHCVPNEFRVPELYPASVQKHWWMLGDVPLNFMTPELSHVAVTADGNALQFVPEEFRTPRLDLTAVEADASALRHVDENFRTPELCRAAVKKDGDTLYLVPEKLRTEEICLLAVKQSGFALPYVPQELKTHELCLAALEHNGHALQNVPQHIKTHELYLAAVKQDGYALQNVPEEYRTPGLCLAAVKQNGHALQHVPEEYRTPELCLAAVEAEDKALEHLSRLELFILGGNARSALQYVPEKYRTPRILAAAVQSNGYALSCMPENLVTPELCLAAVEQDGSALQFVPEAFKTPELCKVAVRQNGHAFQFVPEEQKTPDLCLLAVSQGTPNLAHVPEEFRTAELCLAAVQQNGEALEFVPAELKTPELCLMAVKESGYAFRYVPQELKTPELSAVAFRQVRWEEQELSDNCKRVIVRDRAKLETVEPADFDMATEKALEVYELAALEKPPVILRMKSPYGAMLGSALVILLLNREKNRQQNDFRIPLTDELNQEQVKERVIKKIIKQSGEQAAKQSSNPGWYFGPWWYLFNIVRGITPQIQETLWSEAMKQMETYIPDEFGDRLFESVMNQLLDQSENLSKNQLLDCFDVYAPDFDTYESGDSSWINWRSFVSFFQSASEPDNGIFECFDIDRTLAYSCGDLWWHEHVLAISDRPQEIHRDANGRLHNDNGPSVLYRDGWGLYHWRGVAVPKEWVTDRPPPAREALAWENIEQRRAACEIIGWKNILKELDAKVIDADDDPEIGILFEAELPGIDEESSIERFLQVQCGTGREFVLPVPPHVNTALEANAWTWDIEGYEYRPEVRT